ncbi:MAG: endonuclease/exonuclease/phosphatase family protein [Gammaproteobacteria bacterium]|nr:endonuclease/exonuclease/phosphatase family protein [Gammaproteobacteria bacterium]NND37938.1 endonuclease/exonuclease/phosphatase family protein [Gammaproteobacteria bacterium]
MIRRLVDRNLLPTLTVAFLFGCSTVPMQRDSAPRQLANHDLPAVQGPESCRAAIALPDADDGPALDPTRIDLFVWNMKKGAHPESFSDLQRLAGDKDLVLIQEARLEQQPIDALDRARFWSFAPGYKTTSASTGVMTLSNTTPLTHCYLTDREPWLRSPKAISVTEFGLAATNDTLAVINVHAVNFTLGIADFERQIGKIESVLADHDGPVILAGDFNTWRKRRLGVLLAMAERLDLSELLFAVDNRIAPFGNIVDRVFVRGLNAVEASTEIVETSDHNPMSITLSM